MNNKMLEYMRSIGVDPMNEDVSYYPDIISLTYHIWEFEYDGIRYQIAYNKNTKTVSGGEVLA